MGFMEKKQQKQKEKRERGKEEEGKEQNRIFYTQPNHHFTYGRINSVCNSRLDCCSPFFAAPQAMEP